MALSLQGHEVKPPSPNATFPTVQMTIGFAMKSQVSQVQRLQKGMASRVLQLDFSFNEWKSDIEYLEIGNGESISAYPLNDLIAEKLRAILQQPLRKRARYQDVYDVSQLILHHGFHANDKLEILRKLRSASEDRSVLVEQNGLADPAVLNRSQQDYAVALSALLSDEPSPFGDAYS